MYSSSELIEFMMPAGTGKDVEVTLETISGVVSRPLTMSYCRPQLDSSSPEWVLAGDADVDLILQGGSLALVAE